MYTSIISEADELVEYLGVAIFGGSRRRSHCLLDARRIRVYDRNVIMGTGLRDEMG
jgi:hypothetical protein